MQQQTAQPESFSEALRKGVQQKGEQPLQQGSGGFGISPGGFGF
jgi:hypothetical protein